MDVSNLVTLLASAPPALKGFLVILFGMGGAGTLVKVFELVLKSRTDKDAIELGQEDKVRLEQAARISELEDLLEKKNDLLEKKNEKITELVGEKVKAEAERDSCQKEVERVTGEVVEWKQKFAVSDHECRELQTKLLGYEWMKDKPDVLRGLANDIEQGRTNRPQLPPTQP